MAGTKVPAKFEQGGFTSGRRKGPQTLFPGTSPGNLPRFINRVAKTMDFSARGYQPEFLLARLQKPQLSDGGRTNSWGSCTWIGAIS
jgi:hypothetical protein